MVRNRRHRSDTESRRQLISWDYQGARTHTDARRGLGICRGPRRMEADMALDLLNDLMDVAIQDRDRAKTPQLCHQQRSICGAPAPRLVDAPEWHMCEYDDRRAGRSPPQVGLHPRELLGAECAERARLEIQHIDQGDEVNTFVVEAVIALVARRLSEAKEVF